MQTIEEQKAIQETYYFGLDTFNKEFEISSLKIIGKGGFSIVYSCETKHSDPSKKMIVAIKIIKTSEYDELIRSQEEIVNLFKLSH